MLDQLLTEFNNEPAERLEKSLGTVSDIKSFLHWHYSQQLLVVLLISWVIFVILFYFVDQGK